MITKIACAALAALALAGCTATPIPMSTHSVVAAADTCRHYSQIMTVMANASTSNREGRSSDQELLGAAELSVEMMSDLPVEPGTPMAEIVAALQKLNSSDLLQVWDEELGEGAWREQQTLLGDECTAAGSELYINAWTGG